MLMESYATLATHGLETVELPESIVKEWRRRKVGSAATEDAHMELTGLAASAAGGSSPTVVAPHAVSKQNHCLRRIKRMAPLDDRGMWLLNNLLSQVRVCCHSGCEHRSVEPGHSCCCVDSPSSCEYNIYK